MVQESIVEYINSQMKLGVSRDSIKATLTGAGWVAADVEDTLKKVESAKVSQPMPSMATGPAAASVAPRIVTPVTASPAVDTKGSAPQMLKVSDLVSPSAASPASAPAAKSASPTSPTSPTPSASKSPLTGQAPAKNPSFVMPEGIKPGNTFQTSSYPGMKPRASRGALITEIVLAVVVVIVAGFAGFLFMQNNSLNAQLGALNGQSSGVNSKLSTLQEQVAASTTALTAQVASLTGDKQELQTELSFLVAPSGAVPGATSTATLNGIVSGGGKTSYVITATYGAKVYVANSKAAAVIAALAPLMAHAGTASTSTTASSTPAAPAATAQFTGVYVPGSDAITLTAVNGTAL